MPERMQPIFDQYLQNYLEATAVGDKDRERQVIGWFSSQISALMQEGLKDVLKLKNESVMYFGSVTFAKVKFQRFNLTGFGKEVVVSAVD